MAERRNRNIKKKVTPEEKKKIINMILAAFGVCIVVFTVLGALVIDKFSALQQVEDLSATEEDTYKGEIDERLRFIAMQDGNETDKTTDKESGTEVTNNEPEDVSDFIDGENVKKNKFEEYNEKYGKKKDTNAEENDKQVSSESLDDVPYRKETVSTVTPTTNVKILVGNFATREAAEAEISRVQGLFPGTPVIKFLNGRYTLQVASFKSANSAYEYAESLRRQGLNVRVFEE